MPADRGKVCRLFRLLAVVAVTGYALEQVTDCVCRFAAAPVISVRDAVTLPHLPAPALTLCSQILDGASLAEALGRDVNDVEGAKLDELHWNELGNETIPNLMQKAAAGTEEALSECQLNGRPCGEAGNWSRQLQSSDGDCFTFTPREGEEIEVGHGYGVTFLLPKSVYGEVEGKMFSLVDGRFTSARQRDGGLKLSVFMHDAREPFTDLPWIQSMEPIEANQGARTEIRMAMKMFHRLNHAHIPCEPRPGYSQIQCALACHAAAASAATGITCRVPDMPTAAPLCGTAANYSALQAAFASADGAHHAIQPCRKRCPRRCDQRMYRHAMRQRHGASEDEAQRRQFRLLVYYAGEETLIYRERWGYTVSSLLGEVGGVVGLLLGLSALSVVDAVEVVVGTILRRLAAGGDKPNSVEPEISAQGKTGASHDATALKTTNPKMGSWVSGDKI